MMHSPFTKHGQDAIAMGFFSGFCHSGIGSLVWACKVLCVPSVFTNSLAGEGAGISSTEPMPRYADPEIWQHSLHIRTYIHISSIPGPGPIREAGS